MRPTQVLDANGQPSVSAAQMRAKLADLEKVQAPHHPTPPLAALAAQAAKLADLEKASHRPRTWPTATPCTFLGALLSPCTLSVTGVALCVHGGGRA